MEEGYVVRRWTWGYLSLFARPVGLVSYRRLASTSGAPLLVTCLSCGLEIVKPDGETQGEPELAL